MDFPLFHSCVSGHDWTDLSSKSNLFRSGVLRCQVRGRRNSIFQVRGLVSGLSSGPSPSVVVPDLLSTVPAGPFLGTPYRTSGRCWCGGVSPVGLRFLREVSPDIASHVCWGLSLIGPLGRELHGMCATQKPEGHCSYTYRM